ncbi:hypothetical protein [Dryocola sp. BD613]|uniref:hypothetical protein n=1 Tax=Dryocola sp. BD613 TaxID=3133272 RepID=UPI003F50AA31
MGLLSTELIEKLKVKATIRRFKTSVAAELRDEFNDLASGIRIVDESIKERQCKPTQFVHISLPAPIGFIILDKHLIEIYADLTPSRRKAYKRILDFKSQIAEKRLKVLDNFRKDNYQCLSVEQAMLYETFSLYYVMNQLIESEDNFVFSTRGNDAVVKDAAIALHVSFPYE